MAVWVVAAAAVPGIVALVVAIVALVKLRAVRRDQRVLLADGVEVPLVERWADVARRLDELGGRLEATQSDLARVSARSEAGLRTATRHHGVSRYNAFDDAGGHQSWSLALLDDERSGTVVSSLQGRGETHFYVNELHGGVPSRPLSPEEVRAVEAAHAGGSGA